MMLPNTTIAALIAALAFSGCASLRPMLSGDRNQQRYELTDGSILIVDADGRMRMFNVYGDPIYMKDGVPMETRDRSIIVMKENVI